MKHFPTHHTALRGLMLLLFTAGTLHNLHSREGDKPPIKVYDRFGTEISPQPDYSNAHVVGNPVALAGYFELTFQDVQSGNGTGFDDPVNGTAYQNVAIQVFTDIARLIVPANHPYTGASNMNQPLVKILIQSWSTINPAPPANALGVGSSYYSNIQGSMSGLLDGEVFKAINGGINPWTNLASLGMYPPTSYHGYLAVNLANYSFFSNLSATTAAGQYDLYSIMLHEGMHALGFASLISSTGASLLTWTNFYSRYDSFLHTANGTALVDNADGCYNTSFINPASILTPAAGCSNNITFNGTLTHPVYAPPAFAGGSSLSHFDDACPPNVSYVMTAASGTGPSSMKRKPTAQEISALCDLGYETTGTFGTPFLVSNSSLANTYSYDNSFSACGERVGGVNDFYAFSNSYAYYSGVGGVPATYNDFLQNDENATHYICLEVMYGGGTFSNLTATSFTYTPDIAFGASAAILKYIPVSASGKKGNATYMFINVSSPPLPTCPATNCNLVCNGDFESVTQKYASPLGSFQLTQGSNSPDLFLNNTRVSDGATGSHMGCAFANFPFAHGGQKHVAIMGGPPPSNINNSEGMNFPLSSPMVAGTTYKISFWARNHNPNCYASIHLAASAVAPCPMPITSNVPPATTYCGYTYTPYVITSFPMNNVMTWTQYTYTYTPSVTCNYLMMYAQASGFFSYVFIDDIEIYKTPMNVFAGVDTTICTGDALLLNSTTCTDPALTYSWSDASGPVGSTSSISVSPLVTTTYTLTVTDPSTNVSGTDVITVNVQVCSTGIIENGLTQLSIFPNPGEGVFMLQLPTEIKNKPADLKITNLLGETVLEKTVMQSSSEFNLNGQAKGVYLVTVRCEGKIYTEKIILK
jgi:hypothetical protein